jgi:glycosyl hydrolase family 25
VPLSTVTCVTVFFPDVSHFQTGLSLRGAPAVIAKATQGSTFTDPAYAGFKAQAAAFGIPFAAYHWVDTARISDQAQHCLSVVGRDVPVMWDAEAAGATVTRLVSLTQAYRFLGGIAELVYLPHWWWQDLGEPDLRPLENLGLKLISSNYPDEGYESNGPGWAPYGGVAPTIWQYTSKQAFNGYRIDFNAYRGTLPQLTALFATGDDMALTDADANLVAAKVVGTDVAPGDELRGLGGAVWDTRQAARATQDVAGQTLAAVRALGVVPAPIIDVAELATSIAAALSTNSAFIEAVAKRTLDEAAERLTDH